MKRTLDLAEVSDGKKYCSEDLVKLGSSECAGCSQCCHGMEKMIVLDPYDLFRLRAGAGLSFEDMLNGHAELTVVDGLVLPVLSMTGPERACSFLNGQGRCSIHPARPGICRLFPLGRLYEDGGFFYFLQVHECERAKTKVRIRKWLDTPDLARYEAYLLDWHALKDRLEHFLDENSDQIRKKACLSLLEIFYQRPWETEEDFYVQFESRRDEALHRFGFSAADRP